MIRYFTFLLITTVFVSYAEFTYAELSECGYIKYSDLAFALVNGPLLSFLGFKKAQEHGHELLKTLIQTFIEKEQHICIAIKKSYVEHNRYRIPGKAPKLITYTLAQITGIEHNQAEGQISPSVAITLHAQIPITKTYAQQLTITPIQDIVLINVHALADNLLPSMKKNINDYFAANQLNIIL